MFVALSIVIERIRADVYEEDGYNRRNLPKMKPATKEWYIKTYGQARYDRYWGAMEKVENSRVYDPEKHFFSHRAFHDAESFAWLIIYDLVRAWPKDCEEELSESFFEVITILEGHSFGVKADSRLQLAVLDQSDWEETLHPRLAFLAPLIKKLVMYFSVEWLLWPDLPENHGHEAITVLLREAIFDMKEEVDPIRLRQEPRTQTRRDASEVTSPPK